MTPSTKICCGCLRDKPLVEFHKHPKGKYGKNTRCKECVLTRKRSLYRANPEKFRLARREVAEYQRNLHLVRKYGITIDDYDAILANQGNGCALCARQDVRLVVDHDHTTGQVRGILCYARNMAMGMAGDSADRLRVMVRYLEDPPTNLLNLNTGS